MRFKLASDTMHTETLPTTTSQRTIRGGTGAWFRAGPASGPCGSYACGAAAAVLYRLRYRARRILRVLHHVPVYLGTTSTATTSSSICMAFILSVILCLSFLIFARRSLTAHTHLDAQQRVFRIGVSSVDITPRHPVWLAGFASRIHAPSSVRLLHPDIPLRARAIAIRADDRADGRNSDGHLSSPVVAVVVTLDVIAISKNFSSAIYSSVARRHGLDRRTLRICVTHTHSGPVIADALAPLSPNDAVNVKLIKDYEQTLLSHVLHVIAVALSRHVRTTAVFVTGLASLAVNRRQVPEDSFKPGMTSRGLTCDDVPALVFRAWHKTHRGEGRVIAGLFGYSAHATVLVSGYKFSGDYPSYSAHLLEQSFTNSVWLFLNGAAGDQNIYPRGSVTHVEAHSRSLASTVISAVQDARMAEPLRATFSAQHATVYLPFAKRYSRYQLRKKGATGSAQHRAASIISRGLTGNESLTARSYPYPLAVWNIGDIVIAFLGGEPTVGYVRLLQTIGVDWVVGYSEDVMGYVGTRAVIESGGREGGERAAWYYGLPSAWSPTVEGIIIDSVRKLVTEVTKNRKQ